MVRKAIQIKDLAAGEQYAVQMRALGDGDAFSSSNWSLTLQFTTDEDTVAPAEPNNLAMVVDGASFVATWTEPTQNDDGSFPVEDLKDYEVTVRDVAANETVTYYTTNQRFEFTYEMNRAAFGSTASGVTDVPNFLAKQIEFSIKSRDLAHNTSDTPAVAEATNGAPGAFTLTDNEADSPLTSSLSWDTPSGNDILVYRVRRGTATGVYDAAKTTNDTNFTESNLPRGQYFYIVEAYDRFGNMTASNEVSVTVKGFWEADFAQPDAPTISNVNTTFDEVDNPTQTADLTFDITGPLTADSGAEDPYDYHNHYVVRWSTEQTGPFQYQTVDDTDNTATHPVSIQGLKPSTTYYYGVKSVSEYGQSGVWATGSQLTASDGTPPIPPTGLSATGSLKNITVSWGANIESDLARYELFASQTSGAIQDDGNGNVTGHDRLIDTGSSTGFSHAVGDSETWYYRVRAVDTAGNKGNLNTTEISATSTDPAGAEDLDPPDDVTWNTTPVDAQTYYHGSSERAYADLDWNVASDNIDGSGVVAYIVSYKPTAGTDWTELAAGGESTTYRVSDLQPGVSYDFRIKAQDAAGNRSVNWSSVESATATSDVTETPDDVTLTSVSSDSPGTISARWTAVTNVPVRKYIVQVDDNNGFTSPVQFDIDGTRLDLSGVPAATQYVQVKAVDEFGTESALWSNVLSAVVKQVSETDIEDDAVTSTKISDGAVDSLAKFSGDLRVPTTVSSLPTLPDTDYPDESLVVLTTDGKLYRNDGGTWTAEVPTTDLTGQVLEAQIADNAISTAKIAADAITAGELADNAVGSEHVQALAINEAELADSAVTTAKILDGAVDTLKIAADAVTTAKISADAVTYTEIASGLEPVRTVSTLPTLPDAEYPDGAVVYLTTDSKLYRNSNGTWDATVDTTDLTGTITETQIADDSISTPKLQANAVTANEILAGTITSSEIAADTITAGNIAAGAISTTELAADAVTAAKIAAGTITATEIAAGAITTNEIAANTILAGDIAADTITASELAALTITAGEIAADAITTAKIAADAVTASEILAGTITATEIASGTITASEIAAATITGTEIAADTITAANIAALTITASEIAAGTITASEIAANAITTSELAADAVTAGIIAAGAVSTDELAANAVTADKVAANAITANKIIADAIDATKIAADAIDTSHINTIDLSADAIFTGSLQADRITVGSTTTYDSGYDPSTKVKTFYQSTEPTAENTGDIWYDTDDDNKPYRWDGAAWVDVTDTNYQAYVQSRGENLVTNGFGLLEDNTNFSGFTYEPAERYAGGGSFKVTSGSTTKLTDELVPVDPANTYKMSYAAKLLDDNGGETFRHYGMLRCRDADKLVISTHHVSYLGNTKTELAQDLNDGDTEIHLVDSANWRDSGADHYFSIALYPYTNNQGYTYPDYTYTRNSWIRLWSVGAIDRTNHIITLDSPWDKGSFAAGTKVANSHSGGTYNYIAGINAITPTDWAIFEGTIGGLATPGSTPYDEFRQGTAFIEPGWLLNRDGTPNGTTAIDAVSFALEFETSEGAQAKADAAQAAAEATAESYSDTIEDAIRGDFTGTTTGTLIDGARIQTGTVDADLLVSDIAIINGLRVQSLFELNTSGFIQSENWVADTSGFRLSQNSLEIYGDGTLENVSVILGGASGLNLNTTTDQLWFGHSSFTSATWRVDGAGNMRVGGAGSFYTDAAGNIWSGASIMGNAPWEITAAGAARFDNVAITGADAGTDATVVNINNNFLVNANLNTKAYTVEMAGDMAVTGSIDLTGTLTADGSVVVVSGDVLKQGYTPGSGTGFKLEGSSGTLFADGAEIAGVLNVTGASTFSGTVTVADGHTITSDSAGWSILGDGSATFSNVTIDGGTLNIGPVAGDPLFDYNFQVTSSGVLSAKGATIQGGIQATDGWLQNLDITGLLNIQGDEGRIEIDTDGIRAYDDPSSAGDLFFDLNILENTGYFVGQVSIAEKSVEDNENLSLTSTALGSAELDTSGQTVGNLESVWMSPDGTKLFVSDSYDANSGAGGAIHRYDSSRPWEITEFSYVTGQTFVLGVVDRDLPNFTLNPDGTMLFLVNGSGNVVKKGALSTPFDLTTLSWQPSEEFTLAAVGNDSVTPRSIEFSRDGTKMYIADPSSNRILEYALSTSWNPSTATYTTLLDTTTDNKNPHSVRFTDDGLLMFLTNATDDDVDKYALGTAWDLSTAAFDTNKSVAAAVTQPLGIALDTDGDRYYVVGTNTQKVHQYEFYDSNINPFFLSLSSKRTLNSDGDWNDGVANGDNGFDSWTDDSNYSGREAGNYIEIDLQEVKDIAEIRAAWYRADLRTYKYKIKYSVDGVNWHYARGTAGTNGWVQSRRNPNLNVATDDTHTVDRFNPRLRAKYIRIYGGGNNDNDDHHIYEIEIYPTYAPDDLLTIGENFSVDKNGNLFATSGTFSGFITGSTITGGLFQTSEANPGSSVDRIIIEPTSTSSLIRFQTQDTDETSSGSVQSGIEDTGATGRYPYLTISAPKLSSGFWAGDSSWLQLAPESIYLHNDTGPVFLRSGNVSLYVDSNGSIQMSHFLSAASVEVNGSLDVIGTGYLTSNLTVGGHLTFTNERVIQWTGSHSTPGMEITDVNATIKTWYSSPYGSRVEIRNSDDSAFQTFMSGRIYVFGDVIPDGNTRDIGTTATGQRWGHIVLENNGGVVWSNGDELRYDDGINDWYFIADGAASKSNIQAGGFQNVSDERVKTNIVRRNTPADRRGASDRLRGFEVVEWDDESKSDRSRRLGFSAQSAMEQFGEDWPGLRHDVPLEFENDIDEDGKIGEKRVTKRGMSLDIMAVVAELALAVQDLTDRVEALEGRGKD